MNTVKLYGRLAEVFGDTFVLDVFSPAEAFRALTAQLPGWLDEIRRGDYYLIREFPFGGFALTEQTLMLGMRNTTVHILPVAEGENKKGVGKMVLGVGLIAASIFMPGIGLLAASSLMTASAWAVGGMALGLSLLFGGAAMLLAPTPKMDDDEKDDRSFLFSGDMQTAGQGIAVPLTYGRDRVRPIPIATVINTNQLLVPPGGKVDKTPDGGGTTYPPTDGSGDGGSGGSTTPSDPIQFREPIKVVLL